MRASPVLAVIMSVLVLLFLMSNVCYVDNAKVVFNWTYFSTYDDDVTTLSHNVTMHEIHPWVALLCPRDFHISQIIYSYDRVPREQTRDGQNVITLPMDETRAKTLEVIELADILQNYSSIPKAFAKLKRNYHKETEPNEKEFSYIKLWGPPSSSDQEKAVREKEEFPYVFSSNSPDLFPPNLPSQMLTQGDVNPPGIRPGPEGMVRPPGEIPPPGSPGASQHPLVTTMEPDINITNTAHMMSSDMYLRYGPCPTLMYCIGYQSCSFHCSNEFCNSDPYPRLRKILNAQLICKRDNELLNSVSRDGKPVKDTTLKEMTGKQNKSLHITYQSKIETLVRDYTNTVINAKEVDEDDVFNLACPTLQEAKKIGSVSLNTILIKQLLCLPHRI